MVAVVADDIVATTNNCRDTCAVDETRVQTDEVQILNKVKIKNTKNNAVMTYTLVSDSEANLKEGKIAVSTPIAQGLMGKKVGDIVEIKVPSGMMSFEIMDISI